jgi:hypothetical protein
MSVDDVLSQNVEQLMSVPGVTGVGVGEDENGQPVISVMVAELTPELKSRLPTELGGYRVRLDVTGEITAF